MKARHLFLVLFLFGLAHGAPPEKSAELFIQTDGSVLFQKKTVPLARLSKTLTKAGFGKGSSVLLHSAADAKYSAAKAVLDALAVEPSRTLTFSVEDDEDTKTGTPEATKIHVPTSAPAPFPVDTLGIGARGKAPEAERYFFMAEGDSATLHLRNDTGKPVAVRTPAGDATGARPVLHASYFLAGEITKDAPITLTNLLEMNFVFHGLRSPSSLAYVAAPGDEFDITLEFAALSDPKDPRSERKPLPKGNYYIFLDVVDLQDAGSSGLPKPLFEFQMKVQ